MNVINVRIFWCIVACCGIVACQDSNSSQIEPPLVDDSRDSGDVSDSHGPPDTTDSCTSGQDGCVQTTCVEDESLRCDGVDDCPAAADESGCAALAGATLRQSTGLRSGGEIIIDVARVDPSAITVAIDDFRLVTTTEQTSVRAQIPTDVSGDHQLTVGAGSKGATTFDISIDAVLSALEARDAVDAYKREFDTLIEATEVSAATYEHLSFPQPLLEANEALVPKTTTSVPTLSADEAVFVASRVSQNESTLRSAEATSPAARKAIVELSCEDLELAFQTSADQLEAGGELLETLRAENLTNTHATHAARQLSEVLLYGLWTESLRIGLSQYDDYLSLCADTSYELRDSTTGSLLEHIVSGLQYVPIVRRVVQLFDALFIEAVGDTRMALGDVVYAYQDILDLSDDLDTSFLSVTTFTQDLDEGDVEVTVPEDTPALLDFINGVTGVLELTWLQLFGDTELLDVPFQILDLTTGRTGESVVSVEIPPSPLFCQDPSTHELSGKYLVSLGGDLLNSQILLELNVEQGGPGLTVSLTPLVRDSCRGLGGLLGCLLGAVPRLLLGLPIVGDLLDELGNTTEFLFEELHLTDSAWKDVPGGSGTFALQLNLKPCGTEDFCGDGFLESTDGSAVSLPLTFAAERVNSVSSNETPNPKSSCPEL